MLNNIVTTMNNVGSTTLLHPVFINLEQVIILGVYGTVYRVGLWFGVRNGMRICIIYSLIIIFDLVRNNDIPGKNLLK